MVTDGSLVELVVAVVVVAIALRRDPSTVIPMGKNQCG